MMVFRYDLNSGTQVPEDGITVRCGRHNMQVKHVFYYT